MEPSKPGDLGAVPAKGATATRLPGRRPGGREASDVVPALARKGLKAGSGPGVRGDSTAGPRPILPSPFSGTIVCRSGRRCRSAEVADGRQTALTCTFGSLTVVERQMTSLHMAQVVGCERAGQALMIQPDGGYRAPLRLHSQSCWRTLSPSPLTWHSDEGGRLASR